MNIDTAITWFENHIPALFVLVIVGYAIVLCGVCKLGDWIDHKRMGQ